MASFMEIERLSALLDEASAAGCIVAWIDDGRLLTGSAPRQPRFSVDMAAETLSVAAGARGNVSFSPAASVDGSAAHRIPTFVEIPSSRYGRTTGRFSLILEGKLYAARSQRELLLTGLQAIERERPGTLGKLAAEKGRTKRIVSRQREILYDKPHLAKHAEEIEGGWWVATNNSYPEVEKFVRRAAWHAGLHVELRRSP